MILQIALSQIALSLTLAPPPSPPDKWFGSDKLKHFLVAAFTQSVAYSALQAARVHHDAALAGAWAVTGAVSVAKEVHDQRSYGLFSVKDLVWDAAGAGTATLLIRRSVRTQSEDSAPAAAISSFVAPASLLSGVVPRPIFTAGVQPNLAPRR